jgi:predicted regulator of Ras-like GTPase activity (Roadblock/LC7/MglB family)
MFTLPPLIEEDVSELQTALGDLITRSEANMALVIDKGGFVVAANGVTDLIDTTTLAALAAASYTANQAIAGLIQEPNFTSVYQQGEQLSLLVNNVDEQCLLVVVFKAHHSVGVVKYYAAYTIQQVAAQLRQAQARAPGEGLDLSMLNLADPSAVFRRK